jgi:hypothetical protein
MLNVGQTTRFGKDAGRLSERLAATDKPRVTRIASV